jgi:trehalose 6-phosphate synthase/phosphatase
MHMARRLIIASNRLPVSIREEHGVLSLSRSNGGLATALASLFDQESSLWVGWTGLRRELSGEELLGLSFPPGLVPVNLTETEIINYYDYFSNGILWPSAHGLSPTVRYTDALWREVRAVTKRFADTIEATVRPDDDVWIHDYHLMLLPSELRRRGLKNRIGFFLHTPFPTLAPLRNVPHARELVSSLLAADLLGLQISRDVRRLRTAVRGLGLSVPKKLQLASFPIGIDFDSFDTLNDDAQTRGMAAAHKKAAGGETVILSLSRLDYTKGIATQLKAFETLVRSLPDPTQVRFRLNIAPSRESMLEYRELRQEIEQTVRRINARYGTASWQPVDYSYENFNLEQIAAWYQAADIHLNTPVADGMNLIAKEYVAARRQPGILIISSTMGAAQQLKEALVVPPKDTKAIAHALKTALAMTESEKARRWTALRNEVKTHQAADWAAGFLNRLVS